MGIDLKPTEEYFKIFEQTMETAEGDAVERLQKATHEMRMAILKDAPVWMKFNMISWMISNGADETIKWDKVNEMLKSDFEYDFDAFDYIDSKKKFHQAAADSRISTIKGFDYPFKKIICKNCGTVSYLTIGQVMFYCKHEYQLPKRCPNCLSIKNTGKPLPGCEIKKIDGKCISVCKEVKGYTPGYSQPLNGFAEALAKAGMTVSKEEIKKED